MSVSIFIISCNDSKQTQDLSDQSATTHNYLGKPVAHEYDVKIDSIISQMTLDEKVGMLHGTSMFTTAGVER